MLEIGGMTIISRCAAQARKAGFEPYVATDSEAIAEMFYDRGIMTGDCASGTDRVAAAAEIIDPEGKHEFVINYQGDMPFLDPEDLKRFVAFREQTTDAEIATAYCVTNHVNTWPTNDGMAFSRLTIHSHIGLYGFRREALRKFASLSQSEDEKTWNLEQLRASFSFSMCEFPYMPIEINAQADLDRARSCLM